MQAKLSNTRHEIAPQTQRLFAGKSYLTLLLFCSFLLVGVVWTLIKAATSAQAQDMECFIALSIEGAYFALALALRHAFKPIYLFEPYTMVTVVYILVYHVAAVFQFSMGDPSRYGVDVTGYAPLACLMVIMGHLAFTVGYSLKRTRGKDRSMCTFYNEPADTASIARYACIVFCVSLALYLTYRLSQGDSLFYILTGGLSGEESNTILDSPLSFLSYCSYSCIGAWLLILFFGKNKIIKLVFSAVLMSVLFFNGTRAAILIPPLASLTVYYINRQKSPALSNIAIALLLLVLLFAVMQVARTGIRTGIGVDLSGQTLSSLFSPFYAEIDDFKVFYGLLGVVPERHAYLMGSQMILYSLTILVPRTLWPAKPQPQIHELINLLYGKQAVMNGVAYPNLGEYYVEFGVVGIALCMFLLGMFCHYAKCLYSDSQGKSLALALYGLLYSALFQVVIRGYMPQNFTMILFLIAPVVFVGVVNKYEQRKLSAARRQ